MKFLSRMTGIKLACLASVIFFSISCISYISVKGDKRPCIEFTFDHENPVTNTGTSRAAFSKRGVLELREGRSGPALYFDGSTKYIYAEDTNELDYTEYTCMGWVYPVSGGTDPLRMEVLEKTNAYWVNRRADTGFLRAGSFLQLDSEPPKWYYLDSPHPVPFDTWTHVASTYDGKVFKLYVNGRQVSTKSGDNRQVEDTTGTLTIGCKMNFDGTIVAQWNGYLDDIRIFDSALDETEINAWKGK